MIISETIYNLGFELIFHLDYRQFKIVAKVQGLLFGQFQLTTKESV